VPPKRLPIPSPVTLVPGTASPGFTRPVRRHTVPYNDCDTARNGGSRLDDAPAEDHSRQAGESWFRRSLPLPIFPSCGQASS